MTKEEKLEKLENSIMDELASITDPQVLNAKLQALCLIAQIKRTYQDKEGVIKDENVKGMVTKNIL